MLEIETIKIIGALICFFRAGWEIGDWLKTLPLRQAEALTAVNVDICNYCGLSGHTTARHVEIIMLTPRYIGSQLCDGCVCVARMKLLHGDRFTDRFYHID